MSRPEIVERLAPGADPAHLRAALATHLVRFRTMDRLNSEDLWLWLDATGLTSDPAPVTQIAQDTGVTRRTVERRLDAVDASIARILTATRLLAHDVSADPLDAVNLLALRSEASNAADPGRDSAALDAFTARILPRDAQPPQLTKPNHYKDKDKRYRDSWRVPSRLLTIAARPPLRPPRLVPATRLSLTDDPHDALRQLNQAYAARRTDLYEFLLSQAERAIPDVHAAGPQTRLALLEIAHVITRDAENVVALRYARAWELEAAALPSPHDRELAVLKARAGQAHVCQMFGLLDSANQLYRSAAAIAATGEFGPHRREAMTALHDVLGQIVFTEALIGIRRDTVAAVLDRMAAVADELADGVDVPGGPYSGALDIGYTLARRRFEAEFAFSTSKHTLSALPVGRVRDLALHRAYDAFSTLSAALPSTHRILAAADLGMAWSIRERDMATARTHFARFAHVSEHVGSFANLSYRMQSRIRSALGLMPDLTELPEVPGLTGPWRSRGHVPQMATGLLVHPQPGG
ncbi:hypothetical protein ACSHWB_21825 [Lentzea sp. HUAS TT2]|uniref:hypothetical protein n=1 Tax=Lentzea sp. HUAS TT2 TaxID=3447454 RepID=UPI003F6EB01E